MRHHTDQHNSKGSPGTIMKETLIAGLLSMGLLAAMAPGAVVAKDDQTNLGRCLSEAKQALKGTGIKIKVGQFDNILLGTNGQDEFFPDPGRSSLFCGFAGNDGVNNDPLGLVPGDVFVAGNGNDPAELSGGIFIGGSDDNEADFMDGGTYIGGAGIDMLEVFSDGTFYGGPGNDYVETMYAGTFNGGPGTDCVEDFIDGTLVSVEQIGGCP